MTGSGTITPRRRRIQSNGPLGPAKQPWEFSNVGFRTLPTKFGRSFAWISSWTRVNAPAIRGMKRA